MKEEWKIIFNYNRYSISNFGRLKNNKTRKILKGYQTKIGYIRYKLYTTSKSYVRKFAHVLVAESFLFRPIFKKQVDHINNLKDDNIVTNLRWVSYIENQQNRRDYKTKRNNVNL